MIKYINSETGETEEPVSFEKFYLQSVELKNKGTSILFKWSESYEDEDEGLFEIEKSVLDHSFRNNKPLQIFNQIAEHVVLMNKHDKEEADVDVLKVHIWNAFKGEQVIAKIDYKVNGLSDKPAKCTTNKVVLSSQYYEDAETLKGLIVELEANAFQFLIHRKLFEPETISINISGSTVSFGNRSTDEKNS